MAYKDPEARREYNRQRAASLYEDYVTRRDALMLHFGDECYLCAKAAGKHFHLHHVEYHPTESDYPRSGRSLYVRIKRLSEAEATPGRFRLLCAGCHGYLEMVLGAAGKGFNKDRLLELLKF